MSAFDPKRTFRQFGAHYGSDWPEQAGADFLILLGVELHIVQRWAANLATTLTLAVRIAEQGTL